MPDFTKLSGDELIAKLGAEPLAQSHLAWQAIADRGMKELTPRLRTIAEGKRETLLDDTRIAALWALRELGAFDLAIFDSLAGEANSRHLRREALMAMPLDAQTFRSARGQELIKRVAALIGSVDPEVRASAVRAFAKSGNDAVPWLLRAVRDPLTEPTTPSARGKKPIPVREAYDRAFERFLVRMALERHPDAVAKFLDSDAARELPVEARLLASLALEPKSSAARVAKLLPKLQRAPGQAQAAVQERMERLQRKYDALDPEKDLVEALPEIAAPGTAAQTVTASVPAMPSMPWISAWTT